MKRKTLMERAMAEAETQCPKEPQDQQDEWRALYVKTCRTWFCLGFIAGARSERRRGRK